MLTGPINPERKVKHKEVIFCFNRFSLHQEQHDRTTIDQAVKAATFILSVQ